MKRRYPSRGSGYLLFMNGWSKSIWVIQPRHHEWAVGLLVCTMIPHQKILPRVSWWLQHGKKLDTRYVAWEKPRYPLRSGYLGFSHCSTVLQGVSVNFSLQHCSAASIFCQVGVECLVWENGVKFNIQFCICTFIIKYFCCIAIELDQNQS